MLADEPFSDRPRTTSPVIGAFLRTYNDGLDDERRQDLYPLAALIVGTAARGAVEEERVSRCLAFARGLGCGVPCGRAAMGMATAEASGAWAARAALRAGPSAEIHPRALAFVRELVCLRAPRRRGGWLAGLVARDPRPLRGGTGADRAGARGRSGARAVFPEAIGSTPIGPGRPAQ